MHYLHNHGRDTLRIDEVIATEDANKHMVHATILKGGITNSFLGRTNTTDTSGRTREFIATTAQLEAGYIDACFF
ncbi:MAG: hypothetical protein DRP45_10325 [Candidatus Zixiibacteriota bacterium]|nr:MAG: hypothetical protein DRP45_10325 [candidate division Zixibacteria bacterium]